MKTLVVGLLLAMVFVSISWAEPSNDFETKWICEKQDKKEVCYLDVKNKNIHLKIFPCGEVKKEVWKELNPNEERNEGRTWGQTFNVPGTYGIPTPGIITVR